MTVLFSSASHLECGEVGRSKTTPDKSPSPASSSSTAADPPSKTASPEASPEAPEAEKTAVDASSPKEGSVEPPNPDSVSQASSASGGHVNSNTAASQERKSTPDSDSVVEDSLQVKSCF